MTDVLQHIHPSLQKERGEFTDTFCLCIWRKGSTAGSIEKGKSVGEFLSDPANQSGTWLIDGGWGGPPGPIHVRWNGSFWENGGYCGWRWREGTAGS